MLCVREVEWCCNVEIEQRKSFLSFFEDDLGIKHGKLRRDLVK